MDNSAFGIPEQLLTTLRILNLDPDNLKWTLTQNKQGVLLKLVWRNQRQLAHSEPKPKPIIVNVMDRGDHDGARLHFAEKQIKLTENKENEKPVLAARTIVRRKGNPNMEKEFLRLSLLARNLETREG